MARQADESTDTLESDIEQVYQSGAPQGIQLSAKSWITSGSNCGTCARSSLLCKESIREPQNLWFPYPVKTSQLDKKTLVAQVLWKRANDPKVVLFERVKKFEFIYS